MSTRWPAQSSVKESVGLATIEISSSECDGRQEFEGRQSLPGECQEAGSLRSIDYRRYPPGLFYAYSAHGHQLTLVRRSVEPADIRAFSRARLELQAAYREPLIRFFLRVGDFHPWEAVPYAWPLSRESQTHRYLMAGAGETSPARLTVRLIDFTRQVVVSTREAWCDSRFSFDVHTWIQSQATRPFEPHAYMRAIVEAVVPAAPSPGERFGLLRVAQLSDHAPAVR